MNVQEQIAKLESLLGRIRRNAAAPRPAAQVDSRTVSAVSAVAAPAAAAPVREEPAVLPSPPAPEVVVMASAPSEPPPRPIARLTPPAGTPAVRVADSSPPELEELDMMDEEIVEIDVSVAPPPITAADATELDLDGAHDEPIPESAPRAAQALADQADLDPPVKTPPPESGRQIMAPPSPPALSFREEAEEADLAGSGDIDALLEADHSGGPISRAAAGAPTMEQLGDTVELEGADAPGAELELQTSAPDQEIAPDELEIALPQHGFSGGYDAALAPPSAATRDLERHADDHRPPAVAEPEYLAEPMSALPPTELAPVLVPAPEAVAQPRSLTAAAAPLVVERPPLETLHAAEVIPARPASLPETFLELLDASLRL